MARQIIEPNSNNELVEVSLTFGCERVVSIVKDLSMQGAR
jgi:hypothetical protein